VSINLNKREAHADIAEKADRTALSRIAVQHADDGYSRRGNFGGSLVHSVYLCIPPIGTNICGSRHEMRSLK